MKISLFGNPILRTKGARVEKITDDLLAFADEMLLTMREAKGIGLAAQQAGRAVQLCVIDVSGIDKESAGSIETEGHLANLDELMPLVLFNPEIEPVGSVEDFYEEGCLSFPEITGQIRRPVAIRLKALGRAGESIQFLAKGLVARVIQHELDHLNGILFIDRMSAAERASLSGKLKRLKKAGEQQARQQKERQA